MSINFYKEDVSFPKLERKRLRNWINESIVEEGKSQGEISFIFCSDAYLLEVNKKFLKHDYFTDIITFDYVKNDRISGDIFISIDRIEENAILFKVRFEKELCRILIHGVLHLIGYSDKDKAHKVRMTEKEDYYLNRLYIS